MYRQKYSVIGDKSIYF
ncbi:unnamed protein product [Linum tenue]|uniref:Uncharacterized protein n=1 Tax=Linum tenue TaxID=586396 RepID=A0AAV0IRH9_9ROSI|nr:unnamed protein product [Linum tenue]CAI0399397.1 unnamed protein product [Linum tenue]